MIPEFNLAQAIGLLSFVLGILCFYQRDDQRLRIMMVVMNLNHALHFALLGAVTACLSALLAVVRTGLSIKTRSRNVAYLFIIITLLLGIALADVWYDLFPIMGTCIGTYALYCLSGIKMRVAFLLGAICWLTNNIIVGSIGGTLLEATLLVVNCITMWRLYIANKIEFP
ncbi:MAG: YgjV family protein [Alteromonadaceae bacterium]|nr:YgjV family protein [Alteromonadaceae bacterium]